MLDRIEIGRQVGPGLRVPFCKDRGQTIEWRYSRETGVLVVVVHVAAWMGQASNYPLVEVNRETVAADELTERIVEATGIVDLPNAVDWALVGMDVAVDLAVEHPALLVRAMKALRRQMTRSVDTWDGDTNENGACTYFGQHWEHGIRRGSGATSRHYDKSAELTAKGHVYAAEIASGVLRSEVRLRSLAAVRNIWQATTGGPTLAAILNVNVQRAVVAREARRLGLHHDLVAVQAPHDLGARLQHVEAKIRCCRSRESAGIWT